MINKGDKVKVTHDTQRDDSPYDGQEGIVRYAPPDNNFPFVVDFPDGSSSYENGKPWPGVFARGELELLPAEGDKTEEELGQEQAALAAAVVGDPSVADADTAGEALKEAAEKPKR